MHQHCSEIPDRIIIVLGFQYDVAQKELDIYLQNEKDEQKKFDELTTKYTSNGEKIEANKK